MPHISLRFKKNLKKIGIKLVGTNYGGGILEAQRLITVLYKKHYY